MNLCFLSRMSSSWGFHYISQCACTGSWYTSADVNSQIPTRPYPSVAAATAAVNAIDKADARLWLDAAKAGDLAAMQAMHAANPAFLYCWGKVRPTPFDISHLIPQRQMLWQNHNP